MAIRSHAWVLPAAILMASLAGCEKPAEQANSASAPPPEVAVANPVKRLVSDEQEYVGRFVAVDSVEVRAQVSGPLQAIHFKDGQMVKTGDLLFTIDRRPFEAALDQAKADLEQAKANLAFAEADLARARSLQPGTSITQQAIDQRVQAASVAAAAVLARQAALRQAELNLEYTEVKSPISGRIGDRRLSVGNLVIGGTGSNLTLLTTIQSFDPIRFEFTFDEGSYLRYLRYHRSGNRPSVGEPVALKLIDESGFDHKGRLDFIDNAIDPASDAIRARAEFSNAGNVFTPGLFGRVKVALTPPQEALLVPDAAIGTELVRKFVYVVDENNVVKNKYVTLGSVVENLRVVKEGLSQNDRVVINGLMRVRAGAKVTPHQENLDETVSSQAAAKSN